MAISAWCSCRSRYKWDSAGKRNVVLISSSARVQICSPRSVQPLASPFNALKQTLK